jgi:large subunit ribosomal protein L25
MERVVLAARVRTRVGKGYAKKLRRTGFIPGIIYGPHLSESIPVEVELSALKSVFHALAEGSQIFNLELDDSSQQNAREVLIRAAQYDVVRGDLQHLDFYEITRGEIIVATVGLKLSGETAVRKKGGVVEQMVREVEVECLPKDIPPRIDVDIEDLAIGGSVRVKDLPIPDEVKILTNPEEIVVSIVSPISDEEIERLEEERATGAEEVELIEKERKEEAAEEEEEAEEE